jgi:hypothetical protein
MSIHFTRVVFLVVTAAHSNQTFVAIISILLGSPITLRVFAGYVVWQIRLQWLFTWAYGKETIRGAERNLPDFFRLCPSCQKRFPGNFPKLLSTGGRNDYEKFLLDSIFPTKLTEFPTKLTEFVPFIFIISQYCPTVKRKLPVSKPWNGM